jgi:hypothetical protein
MQYSATIEYTVQLQYNIPFSYNTMHCSAAIQYTVQLQYNALFSYNRIHCSAAIQHTVQLQYNALFSCNTTHCSATIQYKSYRGHELQLNIPNPKPLLTWHKLPSIIQFINKLQNCFLHKSPMDHLSREPNGMCVSHCVTEYNTHCQVGTQRSHQENSPKDHKPTSQCLQSLCNRFTYLMYRIKKMFKNLWQNN